MSLRMEVDQERLAEFCRKYRVREMAFYGSVLRDDFRPDSDVDVLVVFEPGAQWDLFDRVNMRDELSRLLGRPVDLAERRTVQQSRNYIRRNEVLRTAEVVYAAG